MAAKLVLVRHGESTANRDNEFTGWTDVPLTSRGIKQAHCVGEILRWHHMQFDVSFTSFLKRAIITDNIILEELGQLWVPLYKAWQLNERHYGALRGLNKDYAREYYGVDKVALWRRSYIAVPPLLSHLESDNRYPEGLEPRGESLKMASERLIPYWSSEILPKLKQGKNVLVVAHGSSLRALVKHLESISDEDIDGLEIDNGEPILYEYNQKFSERIYLK
ncbi:2,3-bisphosphoglycerate-dependent phosphoglycerate mutase 1 [Leuconostoc litchii]|uniref:2,3-bisphosphoglycerate-dependent phosphoglycerate mutase n=1 Tax=Leuconostoc litchii TaxID=1981069 RepID=A0A652NDN8_9LACO|nr:2,3-bisphosphoglycerate-dependent phosphoglycerate mutase [Leuconostoc litchii]TYC45993.1 2,3-bisphosphoglycerate-dependent phosphoglycerate mutase [Leuconostoc litchii]GMA70303.1 2,3-bisphosphoglycerate-dependent phosphoglycerate mutase 1 [Leuconostoc litchii]